MSLCVCPLSLGANTRQTDSTKLAGTRVYQGNVSPHPTYATPERLEPAVTDGLPPLDEFRTESGEVDWQAYRKAAVVAATGDALDAVEETVRQEEGESPDAD